MPSTIMWRQCDIRISCSFAWGYLLVNQTNQTPLFISETHVKYTEKNKPTAFYFLPEPLLKQHCFWGYIDNDLWGDFYCKQGMYKISVNYSQIKSCKMPIFKLLDLSLNLPMSIYSIVKVKRQWKKWHSSLKKCQV